MTVSKTVATAWVVLMVGGWTAAALGSGAEAPPAGPPAAGAAKSEMGWPNAVTRLGACLGAGLAAAAGGYGVSRIGGACVESIARQPEAAREMFAPMVVAAGMVEVGMLFAIVVALLVVLT